MVLGTAVLLAIFTLIAIKNLVSLLLYSLGVSMIVKGEELLLTRFCQLLISVEKVLFSRLF